ncbi:hypothetical protein [Plastoroseomonas arctica]|uniref:Uncharacterized protein n=1 Tax=Plastoroseomonas arctica TaxID=1509237 RepID=A0AAF1JU93_9PROT|nr:hypothetical protein [Plastoroseomonas arctica]MBR0653785.1 hypothetical protein [Plastoroseomonas arctica]
MRLFAHPELVVMMLFMVIGVGYLMTLIQKKKPKKKPRNPYVRGNERDGPP